MKRQYDSLIENTLKEVEDVEVDIDDTGWGHFLRLRVQINLKKALARGRSIKIHGEQNINYFG